MTTPNLMHLTSLDALILHLRANPADVRALAERSEDDASLYDSIPTFGPGAGDGGEGWEVLSWEGSRRLVLYHDDASIGVQDMTTSPYTETERL